MTTLEVEQRPLRFRLSNDYRVVPAATGTGGFLVPVRVDAGTVKTLEPAAADLCRHLVGSSPKSIGDASATQCSALALLLTLDGVLEAEVDGQLLRGPAAALALRLRVPTCSDDALGRLSAEALRHAQRLEVEPLCLAQRLYAYNRRPPGLGFECTGDPARRSLDLLGLTSAASQTSISRHWTPLTGDHALLRVWNIWAHSRSRGQARQWSWKVYVSPRWEWLNGRLVDLFEALVDVGATHVKVARSARDLLRSDHTVAYFASRTACEQASSRLGSVLTGSPAHGVPFTAAIVADGSLSRGTDPPAPDDGHPIRLPPESWRRWVVSRLAVALDVARRLPSAGIEPWEYALLRMEAEGIDVRAWEASTQVSATARD